MVLACLLNKGEGLLCDEYTYSHLVEAMMGPKGYVPIPVPMDDFGMTPDALEQVCTRERQCQGVLSQHVLTLAILFVLFAFDLRQITAQSE